MFSDPWYLNMFLHLEVGYVRNNQLRQTKTQCIRYYKHATEGRLCALHSLLSTGWFHERIRV